MQSTGLERLTPRGSKPMRSKWPSRLVTLPAIPNAKSIPDAPGPPGLVSTLPVGLVSLFRWIFTSAMLNVLPSLGLPFLAVRQSCGTATLPHDAVMLCGKSALTLSASDWQAVQLTVPPPAAGALDAGAVTPVFGLAAS